MDNYYYVPVTSRHIKFDNLSLLEVTATIDSNLKKRELGRVGIIDKDDSYFLPADKKQILSQYNAETSLCYKSNGIPKKLILIKNERGLRELLTGNKLEVIDNYLHCFEVEVSVADYILESTNYYSESYNYFFLYNYRKIKSDKTKIKK